MPNRVFIGNFHFEHDLAQGQSAKLLWTLQRINAELAWLWTAVANDGDFLFSPQSVEEGFAESMENVGLAKLRSIFALGGMGGAVELCPWGWTPDLPLTATACGFDCDDPPQEAVRAMNSRRFSFQCETDWKVGLDGAVAAEHLSDVRTAIRAMPDSSRWVVKAEFGMSARERLLGSGHDFDERTENWIAKRAARDGVLFVEPWVDKIAEAGVQFDVPKTGPPELLGVTPCLTDENGQYRGSRFEENGESEDDWRFAIKTGLKACGEMQSAGYFGPVGIDAMRYRDVDGEERIRPIQDINARWTMGRLSLGLRRLLQSGETGEWRHLTWPTNDDDAPRNAYDEFVAALPANTRAIRTSPFTIDDRPVRHGSVVLIGNCDE